MEKPASSTALVDIASALVRLVVLCDYGLSSPDNTFAGLFDSLLGGMGVQVVAVLVSEFHGDERDTRGLANNLYIYIYIYIYGKERCGAAFFVRLFRSRMRVR